MELSVSHLSLKTRGNVHDLCAKGLPNAHCHALLTEQGLLAWDESGLCINSFKHKQQSSRDTVF